MGGLYQLVGDYGDEQVTLGVFLGLVEDELEVEFGPEREEHDLHIGEGGIGIL